VAPELLVQQQPEPAAQEALVERPASRQEAQQLASARPVALAWAAEAQQQLPSSA